MLNIFAISRIVEEELCTNIINGTELGRVVGFLKDSNILQNDADQSKWTWTHEIYFREVNLAVD